MLAKLQAVWPHAEAARNVLQTTLQNANPGDRRGHHAGVHCAGTDFRAQGKRLLRDLGFGDLTPERVAAL